MTEPATPKEGSLRVWWIPQIPGKPFHVGVSDVEQALLLHHTLARYDLFQYENRIKPDYCSMGGLEVYRAGEWDEWEHEDCETLSDLDREPGQ